METINGYTVIASKVTSDGRIIMGARPEPMAMYGFEYVVAWTHPAEAEPKTWVSGDYSFDLHSAIDRFDKRG